MLVEFFLKLDEDTYTQFIGEVLSTDSGGMVVKVVSSLERDDCITRGFLDKILKIDFSEASPKEFSRSCTIKVGDTVIVVTSNTTLCRPSEIYEVKSIFNDKAVINNGNNYHVYNIPLSYLRKVNL